MVIEGFMIAFLFSILIAVYAVMVSKGYGVFLAIVAVILSALVTPVIVLLICLYVLPPKENSDWTK